MKASNFSWEWRLKTTTNTGEAGTVFTCFSGGGGSSMGYGLAGFKVVGCNEIDHRMVSCYIHNLKTPLLFCESIEKLINRKTLPEELYHLDILDGSPPCSSFSLAGSRDKYWGESKKFREGQENQVLDTLSFDFIELAKRLQPKVVVFENVPALLQGSAKPYYLKIIREFHKAGYYTTTKLLNASLMGVPQKRRRLFIICIRKDLSKHLGSFLQEVPKIDLGFNMKPIPFGDVRSEHGSDKALSERMYKVYKNAKKRKETSLENACGRVVKKQLMRTSCICYDNKTPTTVLANSGSCMIRSFDDKFLSDQDIINISTFPQNYKFLNQTAKYVCGMSVPPVMIAQLATQIKKQWLDKFSKR